MAGWASEAREICQSRAVSPNFTNSKACRALCWNYCWWTKSCMTLRTLNYGNYGIFLIMGNAGFCPSTVAIRSSGLAVFVKRRKNPESQGIPKPVESRYGPAQQSIVVWSRQVCVCWNTYQHDSLGLLRFTIDRISHPSKTLVSWLRRFFLLGCVTKVFGCRVCGSGFRVV